MRLANLLLGLFLISPILNAQDETKPWIKSERLSAEKQIKLSKIQYPGDSRYDATYYKLDLKVTYSPQQIIGAVTVNAFADTDNVSSIFLDLTNPLNVDSVILNGNPAAFSHIGDKLNIILDGIYSNGQSFSLIVYYKGVPGSSGFGSFEFSTHNGQPAIYTLSEPYGAKDWWPCKDTPADKVDSADVWITVSTSLTPASNGLLTAIVNNGDGTHTYKWKVRYPIAQYLLSLAIADYTEYTNYYNYSSSDSMPINHFVYPESWNATVKNYLDLTPRMIKVYAEHYGEYPFIKEKYGHAQFGWGGGMEHQTLTSVGGYSSGLIAHELAHQWYGDAITCKDWHHIWLNEGFATYSEGVWIESQQGSTGYKNFIINEMNSAKNAVGSIWVQDISQIWEIFNSSRSYAKGGVVLHMLRGIVGDSTFYKIMRTYTYHPSVAYGVATTEDFQSIAESVSALDLNYFFQEWIYGENYPKYSFVWSKNLISGNLWNLSVKITQDINSNPSYFTMPLQIKATFAVGDTLITVFNNAQSQTFNITLNGNPTSISFDPNNLILKTVDSVVTGIGEEINPNIFSLEQNYPNPFNPSTIIKFNLGKAGLTTLKVYNILGKEVAALINGELESGSHEVIFDGSNLSSGVYFYTITSGTFTETRKMMLMK